MGGYQWAGYKLVIINQVCRRLSYFLVYTPPIYNQPPPPNFCSAVLSKHLLGPLFFNTNEPFGLARSRAGQFGRHRGAAKSGHQRRNDQCQLQQPPLGHGRQHRRIDQHTPNHGGNRPVESRRPDQSSASSRWPEGGSPTLQRPEHSARYPAQRRATEGNCHEIREPHTCAVDVRERFSTFSLPNADPDGLHANRDRCPAAGAIRQTPKKADLDQIAGSPSPAARRAFPLVVQGGRAAIGILGVVVFSFGHTVPHFLRAASGPQNPSHRVEQQQRLAHWQHVMHADDLHALPSQGQRNSDRARRPVRVFVSQDFADEAFA